MTSFPTIGIKSTRICVPDWIVSMEVRLVGFVRNKNHHILYRMEGTFVVEYLGYNAEARE